jgi:hypothetical protein
MFRVRIRSRAGNLVLGALGALYTMSGAALLTLFIVQSWGAVSLIDRALQILLVMAIVAGIWFVFVARMNLIETATPPQHARQRRANAEALT